MTENKRYSFNWERGHPQFWDNHCDLADCYLTCEDVVDRLNELNDENQFLKNSEIITDQKELQCLIYQTIINRYKAKIRDEESLLEYYEKRNYSHATIDRQRVRINTLELLTNELINIHDGIKKNMGGAEYDSNGYD